MTTTGPYNSPAKRKKNTTHAIIENMPDIPEHDEKTHSVPYYVAPSDTVNAIMDDDTTVLQVLDGTSTAPIYVSDYEDCSDVAIRGQRKPKKPSSVQSSGTSKSKGGTTATYSAKTDAAVDADSMTTPPLFDDLLAPPGEALKSPTGKGRYKSSPRNQHPSTPSSGKTGKSDSTKSMSSPSSPSTTANSAGEELPSPAANSSKTEKTKNQSRKFPFIGKKKQKTNETSTPKPTRIDVTALADFDEDPILEKELEEIALTGRSGMISGTPEKAAFDLEHGRRSGRRFGSSRRKKTKKASHLKVERYSSYKDDPSVTFVDEEDDADKSWHGTLPSKDSYNKRWTKRKIIWTVVELSMLLIMIILLSVLLTKKNRQPQPGDPLTPEQQAVYDVVTKVTGTKILDDPETPQHLARQWLLYEDNEVWNASEEGIIQRYSLAVFHFATGGGQHWEENNWLFGPECGNDEREAWFGLNCSPEGEVRALAFDDWGLTGTIPPEVGHLYKLENLVLKNNPWLVGWIPVTFGHLEKLRQLALYNNNLSGVIPDIFEHTKSLHFINIENNNIYGSIPLEISHLTNLETLVLKKNRFEGIVPFKQLASTSIRYLELSHNRFSSKLERSMRDVNTLEYLYLDHNEMRGPIPEHIGELTGLKSIDLGNNQFTGVIPPQLGSLSRLEYLSLNDNRFKGRLPREIGLLTKLKNFNAASNQLSGMIPNLSNMFDLKSLQLYENKFTGTIPESLLQLQSIEILFLSSNELTGTIPKAISRLSRTLKGLYLSDNAFEGSIPTQMCIMSPLEALFLDANRLSGPIPNCFGKLSNLEQLMLFENQLTGSVPIELQNLRRLNDFGLESNQIVGEMPDGVCRIVEESSLDIWADCTDQFGQDPLLCSCCNVCCPSDLCI